MATVRRCTAINFLGYVEIQIAAMPYLLAAGAARKRAGVRGRALPSSLVAISTLAARIPMMNTHAYAASKAALTSWFQTLRLELRYRSDLADLISVGIVYLSAVKSQSFLQALGGEEGPNKRAVSLAVEPGDAAWAAVRAAVNHTRDTYFPGNVSFLPRLYAVWPWLVRRLVQSVVVRQPDEADTAEVPKGPRKAPSDTMTVTAAGSGAREADVAVAVSEAATPGWWEQGYPAWRRARAFDATAEVPAAVAGPG
jgi:short-subunit dehydrogenase